MRNMETVKLNVGGRRFEVSRPLLLETQPNSNLADLILNNEKNEQDNDEIFIDRDGDIFQHVLQYLRNGKVSLPAGVTIDSFITEMEYFTLDFDMDNILLSAGSKRNVDVKEEKEVSSSKPSKVASPSAASAPKATFVFGASVPKNPVGGFQFNTGSSAFTTKESEACMRLGFQQKASMNASKGGNSGGFSFGFNGASAQTPTAIPTEMKESEASTIFGKPKQESNSSLPFPFHSTKTPTPFGTSSKASTSPSFTSANDSTPFGSKGNTNEIKNVSKGFIYGQSSTFGFKAFDSAPAPAFGAAPASLPFGAKTSIKSNRSSRRNRKTPSQLANQFLEKVCGGFKGNEDENDALAIFDTFNRSKSGRIKVSELFDYCEDEGEDFYNYDKHKQILDPTSSGFIERNNFRDWYCQLSSRSVSELGSSNPFANVNFAPSIGSTIKFNFGSSTCTTKPMSFDFDSKSGETTKKESGTVNKTFVAESESKQSNQKNVSLDETMISSDKKLVQSSKSAAIVPDSTSSTAAYPPLSEKAPIPFSENTLETSAPHEIFTSVSADQVKSNGVPETSNEEVDRSKEIKSEGQIEIEEDQDEEKDKDVTSHSTPDEIPSSVSADQDESDDIPETPNEEDNRNEEIVLVKKLIQAAEKHKQKGKYDEAEPIFRRCLLINEAIHGPKHPDTLTCMSDLGSTLLKQEDYELAESLFSDCLSDREASLGSDHHDTLMSMKNLADSYRLQKKHDKAEKLYSDCLSKMKSILGPDHHYTLLAMHGLGALHFDKGENTMAETYLSKCFTKCKTILGPNHSDTLQVMNALSILYLQQRDFTKGRPLLLAAYSKRFATLGSKHPDTIHTMSRVANLHSMQGKYNMAESLFKDCIAMSEKNYGPNHRITLRLKLEMARFYDTHGEYQKPGPLYKSTLQTMDNLIKLYSSSQDKHNELEKLYRDCLASKKEVLGSDDPDTLETMFKFGQFLYNSKHAYEEAMELLYDCWLSKKKRFRPNPNLYRHGHKCPIMETTQVIRKYLGDLKRRGIRLSKDYNVN